MADVADAPLVTPVLPEMSMTHFKAFEDMLRAAERPIFILGGSCWSDEGCNAIADVAQTWRVPVVTEFRRAGLFPATHPCYAGDLGFGPNPKLAQRIRDADLVVLIGARMAEVPSQSYTLLDIPQPKQILVHVFPDAAEIGKVYQPALGIVCAPDAFCGSLTWLKPPLDPVWARETETGAPRFSRLDDNAGRDPRRFPVRPSGRELARDAAGRHHRLQRRRQLRHLGAPLLAPYPAAHANRADLGQRRLFRAGGRDGQAAMPRPDGGRLCPATAVS